MFTQQQAIDAYMISQIVGGTVALILMVFCFLAALDKDKDGKK